ncbi:CBS domain-containing protein CBSX5-like [Canna indica]|uniref:CBS domain-containing protein CBSX5-like n=1 Tax=Canna indica TaxID=4628 RepID=A0AAQ3KIL1_9LILI|nr:CBS domain-containing protein CBSX5-like [Canna indica]
MAVSLLRAREVSDLCIGKPAVRSISLSSTVGDALHALRNGVGEDHLAIWPTDGSKKTCVRKVCMVDVLCYLCSEESIAAQGAALGAPVSTLLPPAAAAPLVRRVEPNSRRTSSASSSTPSRYSPASFLSVADLGLVRPVALAVRPQDPALSALPLIRTALADQTSVAVVDDEGRLVGEISPATLANCDGCVAAALAVLSAGDLMAYLDCCGALPDSAVSSIKAQLREKELFGKRPICDALDVYGPRSARERVRGGYHRHRDRRRHHAGVPEARAA